MECFKCEHAIQKPDHNTVVLGGRKYCKGCADEIILKAKTIEIVAKPTEEVPEFPAKALSKDMDEIIKDNKIGKIDEYHPYNGDIPYSD